MATRHLLELGHKRIAFIGEDPHNPFGFTSSTAREHGYYDALAAAGIDPVAAFVQYAPHDREVARKVTGKLLERRGRPTAVFASSDVQALGVLEAARDAGLDVPRDLSVVGFDDVEVSTYVGITTVRQPLFESGRLGAELLLDQLEGGHPDAREHVLPLELMVRSTTGRAARRR
jgi:DNA-binding LacI/PurR family transcriptional regulator